MLFIEKPLTPPENSHSFPGLAYEHDTNLFSDDIIINNACKRKLDITVVKSSEHYKGVNYSTINYYLGGSLCATQLYKEGKMTHSNVTVMDSGTISIRTKTMPRKEFAWDIQKRLIILESSESDDPAIFFEDK